MKIYSLKQAEEILAKYVPAVSKVTGKDITLQRMEPLMNALDNPQNSLKIIHVAGTSGKTSTAYYISSLLKEAGQKTGLSVSPHILSVTERIQVNLTPAAEKVFCKELSEFMGIIEKSDIEPSYFELLVAFAFWHFKRQKVDYVVMETGLGGLHDATNVAQMPDKVCVITDIGIDHTKILGNTVEQIAAQKAGIIHYGNVAITNKQPPKVIRAFKQRCNKIGAYLQIADIKEAPYLPDYQARNWSLAKHTYNYIAKRDELPKLSDKQLENSQKITVPGRMDVTHVNGRSVTFDGAHNEQKIRAFVDSYKSHVKSSKPLLVVSFKDDKLHRPALSLLKELSNEIIATEFPQAQDLPAKPINAKRLAKYAKEAGYKLIAIEDNPEEALKLALESDKDVVVTGSLYLVSKLKKHFI